MVRNNTRGSLPACEKRVDQGSNPCVPTPRPRDVGKEPPSSKTQRKSPIRGSASTKASCGRAKLCGHGHPDDQFKRRAPRSEERRVGKEGKSESREESHQ